MLGRIGGEEFVCILQRSSAQAAEIVAERVRKAVETGTAAEDGLPQATISIGVAVFGGEPGIEELLHRADQALYAAKREGRNRLRMAAGGDEFGRIRFGVGSGRSSPPGEGDNAGSEAHTPEFQSLRRIPD